jgi:hypothetical protein
MQEFIQSVASKFGINEEQAKSATGGVLNFLKEQGPGAETDTLISKIPGAEDVMQSAPEGGESTERSGTGGMLGGVGSMLGGAGGALAALQGSGLQGGQAKEFVVMLVDYAKQKAGPEQVEQVLDKVPALKGFLQ